MQFVALRPNRRSQPTGLPSFATDRPLLEFAQLARAPPTIVEQAGETVSSLSQALVDLDQDSPEAAATLDETLARLLTVWVFAEDPRP